MNNEKLLVALLTILAEQLDEVVYSLEQRISKNKNMKRCFGYNQELGKFEGLSGCYTVAESIRKAIQGLSEKNN